jgi:hypothetical protein
MFRRSFYASYGTFVSDIVIVRKLLMKTGNNRPQVTRGNRSGSWYWIPCMTLLATMGCGKSNGLHPVQGSVIVNGSPADGAVVLFHPEGLPGGVTASGVAGEDGLFVLSSGLEKGVAAGSYHVTVIWPDPSKKPKEPQMMTGSSVQIPDLLKGRYASRETSKLRAEIDPQTGEVPSFELELP